jgi:hypothetical protein
VCPAQTRASHLSWPRSIRLTWPLPRSVPLTSSTPVTFVLLHGIEFHASVELRIDEPPFSSKQRVDVALESACYKHLFQVFQRYVASVSYGFANVDRDVVYIAMVVHVRCKLLLPMFYMFFRCMLQVCFI